MEPVPHAASWLPTEVDESHEDALAAQQDQLAQMMISWHQQAYLAEKTLPHANPESIHDLRAKATDLRRGPPAIPPPSSKAEFAQLCGPILVCGPMSLHESTPLQSKGESITGQGILGRVVSLGDSLNVLLSELYLRHADVQALVAHLAESVSGQNRIKVALADEPGSCPVEINAQLRQTWVDALAEASTYAILIAKESHESMRRTEVTSQLLASPPPALVAGTRTSRDRLVHLMLARVHTPWTASPADVRSVAAEGLITTRAVDQLKRRGFCILSGALESAGVNASKLHSECAALHAAGIIDPANATACNPGSCGAFLRCGSCEDLARLPRLGFDAVQRAIRLLLGLAHGLRRRGYTQPCLAVPPQVLVSAYPPGAYYKEHADCYGRSHNARQLTCLLYCNPTWDVAADGGCLRIEAHNPKETVDVPPLAGTLVIFDSARVFHSVQQSRRLRFAVTLWLWEAHAEASAQSIL